MRDGDDLHTAVRLTMTRRRLGTTAHVPALGDDVELEIPPGTQPGEVRVVKRSRHAVARGSRHGDLYVRLDVAMPTQLTDEQRACSPTLRDTLGDDAYAARDDDEGSSGA